MSPSNRGHDEPQPTLTRPSVRELDELLGRRIDVLDKGFVRVVDYMGGDMAIVQAARVSYGTGTSKVHKDKGLIRYLMRHHHTTPFEMCELKLHIRAPMDCWRQWIRHRTANVNEYSTRYSIAIDDCQATNPDEWRTQSESNRQGSSGFLDLAIGTKLTAAEQKFQKDARSLYETRLGYGVAREQARKDLPLSTYTEAYWKMDLHNLLHFLRLRMDSHAQSEIRAYATAIGNEIVARWCPITWEAFQDYRLDGLGMTGTDTRVAQAIITQQPKHAIEIATKAGWLRFDHKGSLRANRERAECEQKLAELGLSVPWHEMEDAC